MIALLSLPGLRRPRRLSRILGLSLDGSRLEGVVLRRSNGSLQPGPSFSVSLTLDPLTAAPELVGRELRNHLEAAGIRERFCAVAVPLKWTLTAHVDIPELPEADIASFLQIEAERGFACDVATLQVGVSRCRPEGGKEHALLVGIPTAHLHALERVLRAARLKVVSLTLPVPPRPHRPGLPGSLSLSIGETNVGLQVFCGQGLAALRALEGTVELEAGKPRLNIEAIVREARVTLGQLPAALREPVREIRIFGPRDLAQQLADELELRLEPLGLKIEVVSRYAGDEFTARPPADTAVSGAFTTAAEKLTGTGPLFEFLPPRLSAWRKAMARYSSGRLRAAGAGGAVLALLVAGLFGWQQAQLVKLQTEWNRLAPSVRQLETVQQSIRQFRPWYDESLSALNILRQLTLSFPEDGAVTAKTIEIRDQRTVTCTGTARDNPSLLKTWERLRASKSVAELKVDQIRGKSPMQFTFDFQWSEGGRSEN